MGFLNSEKICPHCGGEGSLELAHEPQCVMSYNDYCECVSARWAMCWTCRGRGKISVTELAVFRARGGPEAVPFRG